MQVLFTLSLFKECNSRGSMDETAIYDFSSVSKFNRNPEPLTTGHLHNSKKYNCIYQLRLEYLSVKRRDNLTDGTSHLWNFPPVLKTRN